MAEPTRRRGRPRSTTDTPGTIQALDRALDMLDLLAARPGLTLSEIAEQMDQSPSTVHRVLHTLATRDIAQSDPATQTWHIGPATFRLGAAFMRRSGLIERARPFLRALVEHTGETANLGIAEPGAALFIEQVETHETIRASFAPGSRLPLHASAIGKIFLAFEVVPVPDTLPRLTDKTLITPDELAGDLARIRARGFAFDDEERTKGMRAIAAPVFDHSGKVIAGLSISGPVQRIGHEHVKTLGAITAAVAGDLTQDLGG
ncbi:IclR family transcriptional regulator [Paracoccus sp. Z330]|uniref:IclR family transcriptional regulator n=1 Tax=Paracoccus onchidii TaxID=3017813 RepID=A0ABT4Z9R1_9RHOB|nr:IclR family transcriptional regulator [Paracoccus onchidii]MDB6176000.1 IclR family transcriptional regulator [Paracoccus onchidii]